MITSAMNDWPLDCLIKDMQAAGLPAPSRIRFKLFTLDNRLIRGKIGALSAADRQAFKKQFDRLVATS
jgi:mRNA interferase MazF